jgi:hypothetical protein
MDRTTDETNARTGIPSPADGNGDASSARLLRGVKVAMAVMGVLILAGFGVIGYEIYRRSTDAEYRARLDSEAAGARSARVTLAGDAPLLLPDGAIITGTVAVGSRLALTVELLDGTQILYFANPADSELVEFLRTRPNGALQPVR